MEKRKKYLQTALATGTFIVLTSVIFTPIVTSMLANLDYESPQMTQVTCKIYTTKEITEISKVVSIESIQELSVLLRNLSQQNNPRIMDKISFWLEKLGLLPSGITREEAHELLVGKYEKRTQVQGLPGILPYYQIDKNNGWKLNICNYVQGYGPDGEAYYLATPIKYGTLWLLFKIGYALYEAGFRWIIYLAPLLFLLEIPYPRVITPLAYIILADWSSTSYRDSPLVTRGLLGKWDLIGRDVRALIGGFVGISITFPDSVNFPCHWFSGYTLFTLGKIEER